MMFLRFMLVLAIALTVVYLSVLAYLCARERERLVYAYQAGATDRERDAFVRAGVRAYAVRVRAKLALAVFGGPLTGLLAYIYVTNSM